MDGIYFVTMKTPIGEMQGEITIITNNNKIKGNIKSMGMNSNFSNGIINGDVVKFSGIINSIIGNISYEAVGTIENGNIKLVANTNKGRFEIIGKK